MSWQSCLGGAQSQQCHRSTSGGRIACCAILSERCLPAWISDELMQKLPPAAVRVMDNAAFHERFDSQQSISAAGISWNTSHPTVPTSMRSNTNGRRQRRSGEKPEKQHTRSSKGHFKSKNNAQVIVLTQVVLEETVFTSRALWDKFLTATKRRRSSKKFRLR